MKHIILTVTVLALIITSFLVGTNYPKDKLVLDHAKFVGEPLASINGISLSNETIMGRDIGKLYQLETELYEMKRNYALRYVQEQFIQQQAKNEGLTPEEFVSRKIIKDSNTEISNQEIEQFMIDQQIPKHALESPQTKNQIKDFIKLRKNQPKIKAYLNKQDIKIKLNFNRVQISEKIETGFSPTFGDSNNKVKIVIFSDFQCPYCKELVPLIDRLKTKYQDKVHIVFKNLPLPNHPQAQLAAEASLCVNDQGSNKFWDYHNLLFANQSKFDDSLEFYSNLAKKVDVNIDAFETCMKESRSIAQIEQDINLVNKLGFDSTPVLLINGAFFSGVPDYQEIEDLIKN